MEQAFDNQAQDDMAIVSTNGNDAAGAMIATVLDGSFSNISENQKTILNSQSANRELLGVIIQDNFNLKDENNRLRERILELEKNMARLQQRETDRLEAIRQEFDAKLMAVQKIAADALAVAQTPAPVPEIQTVNSNPGCLGALFGWGGGTQVVTAASSAKVEGASHQPAQSVTDTTSHPKPMFPPE